MEPRPARQHKSVALIAHAAGLSRNQVSESVLSNELEVHEPTLLRYSWQDARGGDITEVTYTLEAYAGGTRFTYDHTGFSGIGGFVEAQLLGTVRRKMLGVGLPPVLAELARSEPGPTVSRRR